MAGPAGSSPNPGALERLRTIVAHLADPSFHQLCKDDLPKATQDFQAVLARVGATEPANLSDRLSNLPPVSEYQACLGRLHALREDAITEAHVEQASKLASPPFSNTPAKLA